jgi:DNA-binding transcriptional LysR family regulator
MYPGIELRVLRYVVAVADELSFTRAAKRVHVSQPSLSKQIRDLEVELGSPIFVRTKREVSLTEAGVLFVEEARKALRHSEQAANVVRYFRPAMHLHVGCSPYVNPELVIAVRSLSGTVVPNGRCAIKSYFTRRLLSKLRDGRLDAALVILPVNDNDLVVEPVLSEPLLVALPDGHSLARNRTVALSDLRDMPAIWFPRKLHPEIFQQLSDSCSRAGLKVNIAHEVTTFPEALTLVAQGGTYTFIHRYFTPFFCPGVVLRPIKGKPLTIDTGVAYLRKRKTAHLDRLLTALRQYENCLGNNERRAVAA